MTDDASGDGDGEPGSYRRPRLSANGRREVLADVVFDLLSIAGAIQSERDQALRIAEPGPLSDGMSDQRRARFIAMELGYQREKLLAWINELRALADELPGDPLPGQTVMDIPDDAGA